MSTSSYSPAPALSVQRLTCALAPPLLCCVLLHIAVATWSAVDRCCRGCEAPTESMQVSMHTAACTVASHSPLGKAAGAGWTRAQRVCGHDTCGACSPSCPSSNSAASRGVATTRCPAEFADIREASEVASKIRVRDVSMVAALCCAVLPLLCCAALCGRC